MPSANLLTLLDDIASILDDVAILSKTALKKTSGVLGDDLALNAEQVSGVRADRELIVVWAVAKGSFLNKIILVPAALLISAIIPWLITPLLMVGGAFLCYEGTEKVLHRRLHKDDIKKNETLQKQVLEQSADDRLAAETKKIKGAIRTDFILSAEIIVIALGTIQAEPFLQQSIVVSMIAMGITVFVYGLVAGIVKLDDAGLFLLEQKGTDLSQRMKRKLGSGLLWFAPFLMKILTFVGTLAMFLVGGGIIVHGVHILTEWQHIVVSLFDNLAVIKYLIPFIYNLILGFIIGAIIIPVVSLATKIKAKSTSG